MLWFCHIRHHFMMFLGNTWRLKGTFLKLPFLKRSGLLFFFQPSTTEALLLGLVVRHGYVGFDPCTFLRQRRLQFSEWPGLRSHVIPAMEFCSWISMFMHQSCWWSSIAGNFTSNREQNKLKCERICGKKQQFEGLRYSKTSSNCWFFSSPVTYLHNEKRMLEAKKSVRFSGEICNMPERDCVLENPGRTGNGRVVQLLCGPRVSCQSVADLGCCP